VNSNSRSVILLATCAVSDLAAAPLLLGDHRHIPTAIGIVVIVLAVATGASAIGMAKGLPKARPVAVATRILDGLGALPAFFVGPGAGPVAAAAVTVLLSVATLTSLRRRRAGVFAGSV